MTARRPAASTLGRESRRSARRVDRRRATISASTGSSRSRSSRQPRRPRAAQQRGAGRRRLARAPATAGSPVTAVSDLGPQRDAGAAAAEDEPQVAAGPAPAADGLEAAQHVPCHRLDHGPGQVADASWSNDRPTKPPRRRGAPPRRPGPAEPGQRRSRRAPRRARPRPGPSSSVDVEAGEARPASRRASRRPTGPLEQPSAGGRPGHDHRRGGGAGDGRDRDRHVGRRAPRDHGPVGSAAPVPSTSQARSPAPTTTGMPAAGRALGRAAGGERAGHGVGGEDRGQPVEPDDAGELGQAVARSRSYEAGGRGHGGVGHHLARHPPGRRGRAG